MLKTNQNPFPILTTSRLTLRKLSIDDRDELLALRSNEQVNRYLGRPAATVENTRAFIQKIDEIINNGQGFYWVIGLKEALKLIGTICYWNLQQETDQADIGYELLPAYQGQGLMQEAITEVIRYGKENIGLKIITGLIHPDNEASINLLKKIRFILDETNESVSEEDADGQAVLVLKI